MVAPLGLGLVVEEKFSLLNSHVASGLAGLKATYVSTNSVLYNIICCTGASRATVAPTT